MIEKVYIDGTVVVEHGMFYTKRLFAQCDESYKENAIVISPPNGMLIITDNYGSIFTEYYVKEGVACYGVEDGNAYAFFRNHKHTHNYYKNNIRLIERLIDEVKVPDGLKNIFFQQQFVSVFGALEYFLFDTFMGQVCSNYDIYQKVLSSHLRCLEYSSEITNKLRGEHDLEQELLFIEQTKNVVYHNTKQVSSLYLTAFDIHVGLDILENEVNTRNDIVHRFGHTKKGRETHLSKDNVLSLIAKINTIVEKIAKEMNSYIEQSDG